MIVDSFVVCMACMRLYLAISHFILFHSCLCRRLVVWANAVSVPSYGDIVPVPGVSERTSQLRTPVDARDNVVYSAYPSVLFVSRLSLN